MTAETQPRDALPDDNALTFENTEIDAPRPARLLLLACGALAREVLDIIAINQWTHIDLMCLPAILHNSPEKIPDAVTEKVILHRNNYDKIFVLYADCGTGGLLQARCKDLGIQMLEGPHCYSFFEGNTAFATNDEISAFYLTDFLVRQFDAFVIKPLGLDRHPQLRDMYFGHYTKLVYQAQTADPTLTEKARACADRLGLAFEHRMTGYGDLQRSLEQVAPHI